jgi:hypothetical protein
MDKKNDATPTLGRPAPKAFRRLGRFLPDGSLQMDSESESPASGEVLRASVHSPAAIQGPD